MDESQIVDMLAQLPQACVFDVVQKMKTRVRVNVAHMALLELEKRGAVRWERTAPPKIELTPLGQASYEALRAKTA